MRPSLGLVPYRLAAGALTRSKKLTMVTKFSELFASAGSASCRTIKKRTIRAYLVTPSY